MALQATFTKKVFHFGFDARTSRGRIKDKTSWFVKLWDSEKPQVFGLGECGPLPGLSVDDRPDFDDELRKFLQEVPKLKTVEDVAAIVPTGFSSIRFGLETAWLDFQNGGQRKIYDNTFVAGTPIPINGLVWMGDLDSMLQQVSKKVAEGFRCLKLKVGGINFELECDILRYIRSKYFREQLIIRLDANGAFKPEEALDKLNMLARFNIHSIEQPIKSGSDVLSDLCVQSPIPIALDEELIDIEERAEKIALLDRIKPQYIILKPTLHGGLFSCAEWIALAEERSIGWWITSALESNIGLNAICQFTANYPVMLPHGLGTGQIYTNNIASPLTVLEGEIYYDKSKAWDLESFACR
ncbi:MAG: o-succinylbenzoate synthase [Cyclobacteriaceae bacterium]|nr:o-succinylbenzoate synthase [Cyclobacteriaceae bacterium]